MSDRPDRDEKVHDPSPQRLRKAREEGNVFRSREVGAVAVLAATGAALAVTGPAAWGQLRALVASQLAGAARTPLDADALQALLVELALPAGLVLAPLFAAAVVSTVGVSAAQSGLPISGKAIQPKFSRISPLEGFKRVFSSKGAFEAFKAIAKAAIVLPLAYTFIKGHLPHLLVLHAVPFDALLPQAADWVVGLAARVLAALALLAALDFAFGQRRHKKDLMMTLQEVKQETKEQDGDPHVKGRRRQIARQLSQRARLDHAVLKADVVVTNPTHYAIALKYDPVAGGAPVVLAKGIRKRALRIKALAAERGVPTVEDRPLARSLYATVEEGQPIPEALYPAVAAVLAEVYRRKARN